MEKVTDQEYDEANNTQSKVVGAPRPQPSSVLGTGELMTQPASKSDQTALARLISAHAPYDGIFALRVPGVHAIRVSRTATEVTHALQQASVCIIAQGAKSVLLGENVFEYEAGPTKDILRLREDGVRPADVSG
jgi:hypothetical protein